MTTLNVKKSLITNKNKWLHLFLITLFILQNCASNKRNYKIDLDELHNVQLIEDLIERGAFGEALAQLRPLILNSSYTTLHPKLFVMTANALIGLGRQNDAKITLELVDDILKSKAQFDDAEYRQRLYRFVERIGSTAPVSPSATTQNRMKTNVNKSSVPAEDPEPLITNSFFETDLRQALIDISMQAQVPIIWDESIEGVVTYEAIDALISDVLENILFANGYSFVKKNGVYYIGSANGDNLLFHTLNKTITKHLANIRPQQAIMLLPEKFRPFVSVSDNTNLVSISAPPAIAKRIHSDLEAIDAPQPQIEINAVVVEFSSSVLRKLGIEWLVDYKSSENSSSSLSIKNPELSDATLILDYIRSALKIGSETVELYSSIQALSDRGIAKIRAMPHVLTLNGHTATLGTIKEQYFFITAFDQGQQFGYWSRLETIRSGIRLEITPYADTSGYITVSVNPEVDDVVGEGANGLPEISRRSANTTVRVKDGETITIGGLRLNEKKTVERKVPFLGDIPILGLLFGRTESLEIEKELVIFITPHII